jgi:signal transduction histidine kinase
MSADSPLLPLVGASIGLLGLVGILVFAIVKMRKAGREERQAGAERLSEEAFAAATMQAALANRPAVAGGPAVGTVSPSGPDTIDAAVLDALPVGLVVTDEAGVVRRFTALARAWLDVVGPGTGHPYRPTLARWPAIAEGLASVHAGDTPDAFRVDTPAAPAGTVTVTVARWAPRGGRGGAMAVLSPATAAPALAADPSGVAAGSAGDGLADASTLASGLAHELANSLTTVHGYAHMVDRSSLTVADRGALDHITTGSERMLTTVEAFRALVRPLPISPTAFAPADAVQAAIALARQEAGRPDAIVELSSAPTGTVHGDRVLIEEAVAAVIRNAIESAGLISPAPPVAVSVSQSAGTRRIEIVVTDRGPGVPADVRGRVFQPFVTDKPGHAGLGLARASQVLRAHPGAAIALTHPVAGGLVVTIALPGA